MAIALLDMSALKAESFRFGLLITFEIISATSAAFFSSNPVVVKVEVPSLNPLGSSGLSLSKGIKFLLDNMLMLSRYSSSSFSGFNSAYIQSILCHSRYQDPYIDKFGKRGGKCDIRLCLSSFFQG